MLEPFLVYLRRLGTRVRVSSVEEAPEENTQALTRFCRCRSGSLLLLRGKFCINTRERGKKRNGRDISIIKLSRTISVHFHIFQEEEEK